MHIVQALFYNKNRVFCVCSGVFFWGGGGGGGVDHIRQHVESEFPEQELNLCPVH